MNLINRKNESKSKTVARLISMGKWSSSDFWDMFKCEQDVWHSGDQRWDNEHEAKEDRPLYSDSDHPEYTVWFWIINANCADLPDIFWLFILSKAIEILTKKYMGDWMHCGSNRLHMICGSVQVLIYPPHLVDIKDQNITCCYLFPVTFANFGPINSKWIASLLYND